MPALKACQLEMTNLKKLLGLRELILDRGRGHQGQWCPVMLETGPASVMLETGPALVIFMRQGQHQLFWRQDQDQLCWKQGKH